MIHVIITFMLKCKKLIHRSHTGKVRPHEHTSYASLGILLFFVGIALTAFTAYAESPPPEHSSISITGSMPGKPPTEAATINSPTNQQRFSTSPITVSGTCPDTTLVEIFKNDIFAGSTACSTEGIYSVDIDLLFGNNTLVAKVFDNLNQSGPDSNLVTVYYDVLPLQSSAIDPVTFSGSQLLINTDAVFRGSFPNQEMTIPLTIIGGIAPYAINIQWGDATNSVIPVENNLTISTKHIYKKAGTYKVSIQATDSTGRVAFISVAAIINGQPAIIEVASVEDKSFTNDLLVLWPLYTASIAVVISFFLGEMREKKLLQARGLLLPTPTPKSL